jgi:O-antigen/teichoic acid export membrane protein
MLQGSLITIGTRGFTALVNFLLAIISARYLGAEGRGILSIFILNSTVVQLAAGFLAGPGLIFLFPRHNPSALFYASLYWVTFISLVFPALLALVNADAHQTLIMLIAVAWLQSVLRIQSCYLLSRERILANNLINLMYPLATVSVVLFLFEVMQSVTVSGFLWSMLVGSLMSVLAGVFAMRKDAVFKPVWKVWIELKAAAKYGYVIQAGNTIQLLNYRLSFYLIDFFSGKAAVGIFSLAISIAEVLWIIANSFATNLYARISNSTNMAYNMEQTLSGLRLVLPATFLAALIILMFPTGFYVFLFGEEFYPLPTLLPWLLPGVLLLTINIILVHYFSGSGQPAVAFKSSVIAFVLLVIFCFTLIPSLELKGAALASSVSYAASAVSALYFFNRVKRVSFRDFIFRQSDMKF